MIEILKNTPFGFVFEILNESCYFSKNEYEIYLNGKFLKTSHVNVESIYGLKPETRYDIRIKGLELDMDFKIETVKASFVIDVRHYNAKGDGISNDTQSLNAAIYCAPLGATIYIPKGEYLVNGIFLKSNVNLYLEDGARLIQSTNRDDMAILKGYQRSYDFNDSTINASWEGNPLDSYCSLIYGKNVKNVNIFGSGKLDGNGDKSGFWEYPKCKKEAFRPKNISLIECENITISSITSENSSSWNIHPYCSKSIYLYDLKIYSIETSPNTDGINPESSEDVKIIGCKFSVGDDCIAIKSGKFFMSQFKFRSTKDVLIKNCYMEKGHGAVVMGSEISCGVKDVLVTQCYFKDTDRGIRIKTRRGRGSKSVLDHIMVKNIIVERVKHCFVVNMFYNCDPDGRTLYVRDKNLMKKDEETPSIKNIEISNMICSGITGSAIFIYGLPESKVSNITIKNSSFEFSKERLLECPDMMDDFSLEKPIDLFIENGENILLEDNLFIGGNFHDSRVFR